MPSRRILLASLLVAAALRLPGLAARPMHADEAVHADKLGTLLEGGGYAYDPTEYHGPTLYYLALLPAWLRGQDRYAEIDEVTVRLVPAVLGVALVAGHAALRPLLGSWGAALAALLLAVSPAMAFYSRYFIHETLLVASSFGALLAAGRFLQAPGAGPAGLLGLCAGLMIATKETAPIALASLIVAFVAARYLGRSPEPGPSPAPAFTFPQILLSLGVALAVSTILFSSFLTRMAGPLDALRAYAFYLDRAQTASWHIHPWSYYLGLLVHFPATGTPFWTEGLILVLALAGLAAAFVREGPPGSDPRFLRLVGVYTITMLVAYSAIPYKTPWCLLGFLHGLILLAGAGASFLLHSLRGTRALPVAAALLAGAAVHLGWQAYAACFPLASDPRNPYVYAHTGRDVFEIAGRVKELAGASPEGPARVQIMSGENLWPLPFYLRGMPGIEWWNGVPEGAEVATAPIVVVTPDLEEALTRRLYDLPPPGERDLYVSLFPRPVFLRPGVELRGYGTSRLVEEARSRGASAEAGPGSRE